MRLTRPNLSNRNPTFRWGKPSRSVPSNLARAQKRQTVRLEDRGTDGRLDERLVWVSPGSELRTLEGKGHSEMAYTAECVES